MKPSCIRTVVFSPTATSRKIARAIAEGATGQFGQSAPAVAGSVPAGSAGEAPLPIRTIDLTHAAAPATTLPADALLIVAVPVYGGHVAPTAAERLTALRGEGTPAVAVAVYGNRDIGSAAVELADLLARQGFVPVAAGAFVGEHSYSTAQTPIAAGRPDAEDLQEAAAFGARIAGKIARGDLAPVAVARLKAPRTPILPLMRFIRFVLGYRRRQKRDPEVLLPATDAALCTHCGRCAALCPVQAIARGDEERTDPARCIRCCACVKGCPVAARTFATPFAAALARNFLHRKQPVTLL